MALDGSRALVGAPSGFDPDELRFEGRVLVREEVAGEWLPAGELRAAVPDDFGSFGETLHLEAAEALVGAPLRGDLALQSGAVFTYVHDGVQFVEQQVLYPTPALPFQRFGQRLARKGDLLAVGTDSTGEVFVFERGSGTWSQVAVLAAGDGPLAFVGSTLLVGEPDPTGTVRTYEQVAGTWQATGEVLPATSPGAGYGRRLAADGERVAILADRGPGSPQGVAHVFRRSPAGAWTEDAQVSIQGQPLVGTELPEGLAFDGVRLVMGYPRGVPDTGGNGFGCAYVFREVAGTWIQEPGRLDPEFQPSLPDAFGRHVDVDGETLLVGAPQAFDGSGQAWLLQTPALVEPYGFCEQAAPCGNEYLWGGCRGGSFAGAKLTACGSTHIALDDLQLQGQGLRPQEFAFLFVGTAPAPPQPFFDGQLAVSGPFARFQPRPSSFFGTVTFGSGLVADSQSFPPALRLAPGTWFFQLAYRDPNGPCSSGTNLTNGLAVTFVP